MLDLMSDEQRAHVLGAAGRARAEALFDVRAYARRIEALYDDVLGLTGETYG